MSVESGGVETELMLERELLLTVRAWEGFLLAPVTGQVSVE
jgi:hypothetical protein